MRGHLVTVVGHQAVDPLWCEEYGYGLGDPTGIYVLKYRSAGALEFGDTRQDFLHQLYWSPDGMLSTLDGPNARFIGPNEAFWVHRAMSHHVRAGGQQTVYRLCLREVPVLVADLSVGPVTVDAEAGRLIQAIARPGCEEQAALSARERIMAGLASSLRGSTRERATGAGYALAVARELTHDPGSDCRLDEWAAELHISPKTLQRDFLREFGMAYSPWRTKLRLQAARVLLDSQPVSTVAARVGYASPSAFISAFAKEFGFTPGGRAKRAPASGPPVRPR